MYKTKEEIEKEFDAKYDFYKMFGDNSLSERNIKNDIHQIRQDDLNAIKDMIFCNQPIYEKLKPNQILNEIIKYLDNLNK